MHSMVPCKMAKVTVSHNTQYYFMLFKSKIDPTVFFSGMVEGMDGRIFISKFTRWNETVGRKRKCMLVRGINARSGHLRLTSSQPSCACGA